MKILCGIFLIATVMNPLGRIFSVGELSLNTNRYFTGDSEFEFRINDATDRFTRVLTSGDASLMEDTLTRLTGCNVTVSVRDATLCVGGVPHEKRDLVKNYVQSHGAEVVFED